LIDNKKEKVLVYIDIERSLVDGIEWY